MDARQRLNTRSALDAFWRIARLPLLALLTLLEPVVRTVLALALVLGAFAAIVFELSAVGPHFPFLGVLCMSLGFGVALVAYYGLLSLLSR